MDGCGRPSSPLHLPPPPSSSSRGQEGSRAGGRERRSRGCLTCHAMPGPAPGSAACMRAAPRRATHLNCCAHSFASRSAWDSTTTFGRSVVARWKGAARVTRWPCGADITMLSCALSSALDCDSTTGSAGQREGKGQGGGR